MKDFEKTQHYTFQADLVCGNLTKYIPNDALLIEPFVGKGDLLSLFPKHRWETYDIAAKEKHQQRDTLLNPPDYKGKYVITNPPFLAKNKAKEKEIFNKYNVDDLYKAALLSFHSCSGGIVILPTNFLTDERSSEVRKKFLKQYKILELNIFTEPVFESTTYSVCSFAFEKKENFVQTFPVNIFPAKKRADLTLSLDYNYQIAGEYFSALRNVENIFGRLTPKATDFLTDIKLYALDTREKRIRLEFNKEHYIGKDTDRMFATLTCKYQLTEKQQKQLIEEFNKEIERFRECYLDLPLSNYRDYGRKRIGFSLAYKILSKIYKDAF